MSLYKQVIVLREDLGMSRGKMISQACHASLNAYKKSPKDQRHDWEQEGAKKVVLSSGDRDLTELHTRADKKELPSYLVVDAGLTEIEPGTKTALGIGPARSSKIDELTSELEIIK